MATRYIPIDVEPKVPCTEMSLYDLRHTRWAENGRPLTAYFALGLDENSLLKIHFANVEIVRVLDELYLSTEEHGLNIEGRVPYHFAYRVEASTFWIGQSAFFKDYQRDAQHYRFVTGGACLDVLTSAEPSFTLVSSAHD